jgi:hypothetical protein
MHANPVARKNDARTGQNLVNLPPQRGYFTPDLGKLFHDFFSGGLDSDC